MEVQTPGGTSIGDIVISQNRALADLKKIADEFERELEMELNNSRESSSSKGKKEIKNKKTNGSQKEKKRKKNEDCEEDDTEDTEENNELTIRRGKSLHGNKDRKSALPPSNQRNGTY